MTSEWMGLHNPERHEADASDPRVKWCTCFTAMTEHLCTPDRPCPCCVEAEAERLRALVQRVRELHGRHDPNCPYGQDCAGAGLCLACREEYPCATICALDGSNSPPVTSEIAGPLIDPDCRDGKHSSCVGGPCECSCHGDDA